MPITKYFKRVLAVITCAICLSAAATVPNQTVPIQQAVVARIKLDERSMVIVPVNINGSGPYEFLLDTGSSKTMVDHKLAEELLLPQIGKKSVVGVLASAKLSLVHANSVSVMGATVSELDMFSPDHSATVTSKVRGVLGEDFLQNFDLLIDYRHQMLRIESPLGSMANSAAGEHLPLQLTGTYHGQPTHNRLVISGHAYEFGDTPISLLLDSGASSLTLFRENLGAGANPQESAQLGNFEKWINTSTSTRILRFLYLGGSSLPHLTAVAVSRRAEVDTDGLIPTSLFDSIFISHQGRFAILNPTFPKANRDGLVAPMTR